MAKFIKIEDIYRLVKMKSVVSDVTAEDICEIIDIVHCSECKYFYHEVRDYMSINHNLVHIDRYGCDYWEDGSMPHDVEADGYCNFGERKESD